MSGPLSSSSTAPAQFYRTKRLHGGPLWLQLSHACLCIPHHGMNHKHISDYLPVSIRKLRLSGGVTGAGVRGYLGSVAELAAGLVAAPSKDSASECPAGWPCDMVQGFSLCLVHSQELRAHHQREERKAHPEMLTTCFPRKGSCREPKVTLRSDPVRPNYSLTQQVRALS